MIALLQSDPLKTAPRMNPIRAIQGIRGVNCVLHDDGCLRFGARLRRWLVPCIASIVPAQAQMAVPSNDEPVRLEPMTVWGEANPGWPDAASARSGDVPANLAATVERIPGLAMHHMGAAAAEPLLRGLGSDRVVTSLDGLPLPNASPTRTASPLALIAGGLTGGLAIDKAVPSVALGPPANAGYIGLSLAAGGSSSQSDTTDATADWDSDRDGGNALVREISNRGPWKIRIAAAAHSLGDYSAGDGTVVPADDRGEGVALDLGWKPDSRSQFRLGALLSRQELAVNSALPLDTRRTNLNVFTGGHRWTLSDQTWIDTRIGAGVSRPHLDNSGRPAPARVAADGRTASLAAGISIRHKTALSDEFVAGIDRTEEDRDMQRKRSGAVDLLWPDLRQTDVGGFAETTQVLSATWKLRLGARLDAATSEARAADGLAFNRTIRDLYVAYNGPDAAKTAQHDVAGAANALLTGQLTSALGTSLGAGFSRQPPGASERYRAFSDALGGGYEIGNPAARAENKYDLTWGLHWQRPTLSVQADLFASYLPNYLHRARVGTTTPPPPPPPGSIVYGYRATAAELWGGELEILWQPIADSWLRLTSAGIEATDRKADRRLPEIPPETLDLAAGRGWPAIGVKPWVEIGLRSTAAQRNPAPDEMPVFANTSAFALAAIRGGFSWHGLEVSLSVANVFNRLYFDYLSPPAAATPPSGSLRPGARIPGPGRDFLLTIRFRGDRPLPAPTKP